MAILLESGTDLSLESGVSLSLEAEVDSSVLLESGVSLALESGADLLLESGGVPAVPSIRESLYQYLSTLPGLVAVVQDRVYFGQPDPTALYPCLAFEFPKKLDLHGRTYGWNLAGPDGTSAANVLFVATSTLESECVAALEAIGLEGFRGNMAGTEVLSSYCELEFEASVKPPAGDTRWIHQINAEYRIVHRATPATA